MPPIGCVAFWGRRPGQVIPRPDWSTTFLPRYDRPFFVRVHRVQCFEESRIGSAACSQGTKSVRSATVASGILRLSPIDRFACRISRADDVPNFTPPGVSKCPNKVGSCAGHKPGLLGDFSRRLAEHHNHRGAIPIGWSAAVRVIPTWTPRPRFGPMELTSAMDGRNLSETRFLCVERRPCRR